MTGSIDLLFQAPNHKFYLLDWKTNCLDGDPANFNTARLHREMDAKFYHLQYLIYTVAFAEFHRSRTGQAITGDLYDNIFGGVFYLFVRGIVPEAKANGSPRGVFFTRPPFTLIENLREHIGITQLPPGPNPPNAPVNRP
jgi:exodeoxyribonuclease V beta subunit